MNGLGDFDRWQVMGEELLASTLARIQSVDFLIELAVIAASGLLALWLAILLRRLLGRYAQSLPSRHWLIALSGVGASIAVPGLWLLLLWIATHVAAGAGMRMSLAVNGVSLLVAWVVIRLFSHVVRNAFWSRIIFFTAWTLAALDIIGVLGQIQASLDSISFPYGATRISALNMLRALLVLVVLLWLTAQMRAYLERRIFQSRNLTPSLQALLVQVLKVAFPVVAVLAVLPVLGLNLTAFAVLGGGLAVGAGLGLQRAVANFVSGLLLLSGGSLRPGDVVSLKDLGGAKTYGRVNSIGALYVSLRTRDGIDYLVPNDSFLSNGVENWTHTDDNVRMRLPFTVAYESDPKRIIALALQAAAAVPRVLKSPAPVCLVVNFGDTSMNFELRFWVGDPMSGIGNVKSEILLGLWDAFHANGIRIPPAQRDIHILAIPPAAAPAHSAPPPPA